MAEASTTTAAEGGLRYLISLPMASPPPGTGGGPVPVLCFLHGQGEASPMPPEQAAALRGPLSATSWAPHGGASSSSSRSGRGWGTTGSPSRTR